jgi:alkylation response protein AidB-like acyl-CoA dehydrogenase
MKVFERLRKRRNWSDEEELVLDQVRRLAAEVIAPNAEHADRTGEFPWANVEGINTLGLNAIFVPEEYGGAPMSYRLYLEVVKLISSACASTGIIFATTFHGMKPLIEFGTEEQQARLLPRIAEGGLGALAITEPDAGSDATRMTTRFAPDGDDIVVDGGKIFITNGDVADLTLLFGKWSEIKDARAAISVLILEKNTPGFQVVRLEEKMGHRSSSTAAISFDGCRVPRANLIGIADAAFTDMVAYMNGRSQGGRRIVEYQGNQFTLADLATDLAMTEAWLDHVAALVDGGEKEFGLEASMAKMRASDLAMRMTTEAVQMHGGYGYCRDYRVERLMRDAKITQIWEGTNQIHRQLIGRSFVER